MIVLIYIRMNEFRKNEQKFVVKFFSVYYGYFYVIKLCCSYIFFEIVIRFFYNIGIYLIRKKKIENYMYNQKFLN